jgi:hypothetical protein
LAVDQEVRAELTAEADPTKQDDGSSLAMRLSLRIWIFEAALALVLRSGC